MVLASFGYLAGQSLSGTVYNEDNDPVPYASIFIRAGESRTGTSSDANGRYFITLIAGTYEVVISSVGYVTTSFTVVIGDKTVTRDVRLLTSSTQLDQLVVRANRRDPAFEIIQHVIDNKERFLTAVKSSRSHVYIKAMEIVDVKDRDRKNNLRTGVEEDHGDGMPGALTFGPVEPEDTPKSSNINLLEIESTLNYEYPDRYKEQHTAYKAYGNTTALFIPPPGHSDFNFYENLVYLEGITEAPVISPVSRTAILTYKYKLEETLKEDSVVVYKISVIPRKKGNSACSGTIYVNDSTWNINRLDLDLFKGGLRYHDAFNLKQKYQQAGDSLWIVSRQEFTYETRLGQRKAFHGNTVINVSNFENNVTFPRRFFGNELAVTSPEAYERDSLYWSGARPEPLTSDQLGAVRYRDSLERAHNTQAYLDSIEAKFNRVTAGEVLYDGVGFRNTEKERNVYFSSLLSTIGFEVIGGWRINPYTFYSRRWESGRVFFTGSNISLGLKNNDLQGGSRFFFRYDPYHLGDIDGVVGRSFYSINSFDAYLNQLKISNYILHDHVGLNHRIELSNGFYLSTGADLSARHSLDGYDASSILSKVIDETDPLVFEDYEAFISTVKISYTPAQRYMSEPHRKVVLGSDYPTFSLTHSKGWKGILGSDIDFDYTEFAIEQNLMLGILGNSKYSLKAGEFVNTRDLRYIDFKRFRQSDPYLYSDPLNSFQLLDTALSTTGLFLEGHLIHHFNGALINNLPLIKKLQLRTVAGAGAMWIQENNYRHEEVFAGFERVFKLGQRRLLRIGLYGVAGQSNKTSPQVDYKISFDLIDTWKREWSY